MKFQLSFVLIPIVLFGLLEYSQCKAALQPNRPPSRPRTTEAVDRKYQIYDESVQDSADPILSTKMHPVTRLHQIQSNAKKFMPIFSDIGERIYRNTFGKIIDRQFNIEVKMNGQVADGWGYTKKEAKRAAARAMLIKMNLNVD